MSVVEENPKKKRLYVNSWGKSEKEEINEQAIV